MARIISGSVFAHKLLVDSKEVDDQVSCQLPSIERPTQELKGAGIMGSIDMPITGQLNSMTFSITSRSVNSGSVELLKPGILNIELRFTRDVMQSDGTMIFEGTKIFISGVNKKFDPGKVENSATMDGSIEFEVLRYRQVIEGREVLLIDKINSIFKINGIDYMEKIRAAL